jgi:hypothetical protein
MIVFEVSINGQAVCRAGAEDLSVITAIVSAVGKLGDLSRGAVGRESSIDLEFRVGGLTAKTSGADNSVEWVQRNLQTGDVVTIIVLGDGIPDEPTRSHPARSDSDDGEKFRWAKWAYFELRDKYDDAG